MNIIQGLSNIWQTICNIISWIVTMFNQAVEMVKFGFSSVGFIFSAVANMPLFFRLILNIILWVIIVRFAASLLGLGGENG